MKCITKNGCEAPCKLGIHKFYWDNRIYLALNLFSYIKGSNYMWYNDNFYYSRVCMSLYVIYLNKLLLFISSNSCQGWGEGGGIGARIFYLCIVLIRYCYYSIFIAFTPSILYNDINNEEQNNVFGAFIATENTPSVS